MVVVIIVAGSGSSSGGDASNVVEKTQVNELLAGIPQNKTVLGKTTAPVTLYEYGDLQCPICKEYSEEFLPKIIENQVKKGEVKIVYRDFIIISEQSIPAGEAALAAGEQGKGWTFIELFYRNQGEERSGYVTDEFLESIAKGAGVKNIAQWNKERKVGQVQKAGRRNDQPGPEVRLRRHAVVRDRRPAFRRHRTAEHAADRRRLRRSDQEGRLIRSLVVEGAAAGGGSPGVAQPPLSHRVDITKIIVRWL